MKKQPHPGFCRRPRAPEGFTLVELLVALAVISILLALSGAGLMAARQSALTAKAVYNARQIGLAQTAFSTDFEGRITGGQGDGDSTQSDAPLDANVGPGPMPLWAWYKPEYRLGFYLSGEDASADYTNGTWPNFYDPSIPLNPANGNFFRDTWAFNGAFNWTAGETIPRVQRYSDLGQVLYLVSGYNQIGPSMVGADGLVSSAILPLGSETQNGFYLAHGGKAIGLYFDGSVSLVAPTALQASNITPK